MTIVIVYTTFPDAAIAAQIGETLIGEQLAACINILSPCQSLFRWDGRIETAQEVPAFLKTAPDRAEALVERLARLHPYDLPVVEHWEARAGADARAWIDAATRA